MPIAVVRPSSLRGVVVLPPSKSHTMRALALAAVARGTSTIIDPLVSPDTDAMVRVITALGAHVHTDTVKNRELSIVDPSPCLGIYPNKLKNREFATAKDSRFDSGKSGLLLEIEGDFPESNLLALGKAKTDSWTCLGIDGVGGRPQHLLVSSVDVGNSGLALRFGTALCSLCCDEITITGDGSIQALRPLAPLVQSLKQLGATASFLKKPGFAPLRLQGPIHSGGCVVEGRDSQPVSALLLTLPFTEGYSMIRVENMGEQPWLAMTVSTLQSLGIIIDRYHETIFGIPGGQYIQGFSRSIPRDASALAFPLAAALMTEAEIDIHGVPFDDVQHDLVIVEYVRRMGARVFCHGDCIRVLGPQPLYGIDIDINEAVDALPMLAVLATKARGKTRLYNGAVCRQKESDRIHVMAEALQQMGACVAEHPDGLTIYESSLHGASLSCAGDHRIAMALFVAGLSAAGSTELHGVECVRKSFPQFFSVLKSLGARCEVRS